MQHLLEDKPAGVENECHEQIAFADKLLLNKIDLVSGLERLSIIRDLREVNRFAKIEQCCKFEGIETADLIDMRAFELDRVN